MKLPEEVRPIWRTVQMFQISRGLDNGLRMFIVGPFLYDIFKQVSGEENAMFYTALVWALYCGLSAFLELPTGALADVFGRVHVLIASIFLNLVFGVGLACLICFKSLYTVLTISVLIFILRALAFTIYNGSFSAWVVDSLNAAHSGFGYERILARGNTSYYWAKIIGGTLGIAMYLHGVSYIAFLTGSMICLCCAAYCLAVMEETSNMHFSELNIATVASLKMIKQTIIAGVRACNRNVALWWLLIFYAIYDLMIGVIQYLWPVFMSANWGAKKWSYEWYGMVFAVPLVSALGSHLLARWGDHIQKKTGQKTSNNTLRLLMFGNAAFMVVLPIVGLGVLNYFGNVNFLFFAFSVLCVESTAGTITPCFETLVNNYIPPQHAKERATILSVGSMLSGFLLLLLMIPSSGTSGSTTVIAWIFPAAILGLVMLIGNHKIKRAGYSLNANPRTTPREMEAT